MGAMYVPEHFRESDPKLIEDFIRAVGIGELVSWNGSTLEAVTMPLLFEKDADKKDDADNGSLVGHLARANAQWRSLSKDREVLVLFRGPNDYITPTWYPTKREHGEVVPTWNYASVQIRGVPIVHDDPEWTLGLVARLTTEHESTNPLPWAVSDAPKEFIATQLRAIVGVEIQITQIDAKWKLSQNQPAQNRAGVIAGLREKGTDRSRDLAEFTEQ